MFRVTLDPNDASAFDQDLLDGKAFAYLRARFGCRIDEKLVEHRPPRTVRDRRFSCAWRTSNREGTEIEGVGVDWWTSGRCQAVEEAPSRQGSYAERMHQMRGHRVARKGSAVDDEYSISCPSQQHRGRGTSAASTHDNRR